MRGKKKGKIMHKHEWSNDYHCEICQGKIISCVKCTNGGILPREKVCITCLYEGRTGGLDRKLVW